MRSGTENVAGVAALSLAAKISRDNREEDYRKVKEFSEWFKTQLKAAVPEVKMYEASNYVPHIISLSFPSVLGEVLLNHLAEEEIYVSTGSACHASSKNLSATLQALKFSPQRIRETVRVSLSARELPENRDDFLERFVKTVKELQAPLRHVHLR